MKCLILLIIMLSIITLGYSKISSRSLRKYMKRFSRNNKSKIYVVYPQFTKHTKFVPPSVLALTSHVIDCDYAALTEFEMQKFGKEEFLMRFECMLPNKCPIKCARKIRALDLKKCQNLETPANEVDPNPEKQVNFFDRHTLKCPEKHVLVGFSLVSDEPKIQFKYRCCPAITKDCKSYNTISHPYKSFDLKSLINFKVGVPDTKTQVMTGL